MTKKMPEQAAQTKAELIRTVVAILTLAGTLTLLAMKLFGC